MTVAYVDQSLYVAENITMVGIEASTTPATTNANNLITAKNSALASQASAMLLRDTAVISGLLFGGG